MPTIPEEIGKLSPQLAIVAILSMALFGAFVGIMWRISKMFVTELSQSRESTLTALRESQGAFLAHVNQKDAEHNLEDKRRDDMIRELAANCHGFHREQTVELKGIANTFVAAMDRTTAAVAQSSAVLSLANTALLENQKAMLHNEDVFRDLKDKDRDGNGSRFKSEFDKANQREIP